MMRGRMLWIILWLVPVAVSTTVRSEPRGEYVARVAGCVHCHTLNPREPLAGGRPLHTPFGVFYPPNLTPDRSTGLGAWTLAQFTRAVREGVSPQGSVYYPAFPYRAYAGMSDADVSALYEFLRAQPAVERAPTPHALSFPFDYRALVRVWRLLYFSSPSRPASRGAYLVEALAHCTECHTERNSLGALRIDRWMGGSRQAVEGRTAPNITPDLETGLGAWTAADWELLLSAGLRPDGRAVGGEMAFVVQGMAALTRADRAHMIQYLMSLTPISQRVTP